MADLIRKMQEGHTVEDLDTVIDEVYEARGEYDSLDERLDDMEGGAPTPSTSIPAMDGTGSAGTADTYARGDHTHPSDTSKQNALTTAQLAAVNSGIDSEKVSQIETNKHNILTVADQTTKYNLLNQAAYAELRNVTYNNGVVTQVNTDTRSNLVMQLSLYNGSTFVTQLAQATVTTNGIVSIPFTYSQEGNLIRIGHSGANIDARIVYAIPTDFVADNKYYFVCTVNNCKQVIDDVTTPYSWQNMAIIPKVIYDSGFTSYQPYAMSNTELTAKEQANENNILTLETMNGAKNRFDYEAWKNCGVFQGTKTINGNSFTIVASGDDCFTWYENSTPRPYPINARIPCNAGDKVVFTWEYTPLSGQTNDRVGIFANGLNSTGFFALALASAKKLEFTAPNGTTYLSIRFGVQVSGNSATYGNIQIQSKASYDAGFTDYQPYAMSNAELTAKEQQNKNNISLLTEKLQEKNVLSQYSDATSNTYTYVINKDDFGNRGIGIYMVYICNWSTIPNVSIYVVAYSGGVTTQSTITKIAGNDVNISLSNGVISYTGDGYFTVSAIK